MTLNRITGTLTNIFEDIFRPSERAHSAWMTLAWILALYVGGIALWGVFFHWGDFPVTFHDWAEVTTPRLFFLKDAILHGILPLHISNSSALGGVTDRYLSIPDAFLSPQALLLAFVTVTQFVLLNQIILYTIGFLGLLWFQRKFSLSPIAFTVLFLLFNFNGHVLSHFAVGHDTWGGYYLFPWFVMLVITLLDGQRSWKWVALMAFFLAIMLMQGSFHQFVWCLLFLGLLALSSWRNIIPIVSAAVFSVGVNLYRLLPPSLLLTQFGDKYDYMGGYSTIGDVWQSLTSISLPGKFTYPPFVKLPLGTWEFNLYIGLLGVAFLVVFGVYFWWKNRAEEGRYNVLILPMLALAILSMGNVFQLIRDLHIPLMDGERVSSRMISLPFAFLIILAVVEFQRWLDRVQVSRLVYLGMLVVLFAGAADMWQNFSIWEVSNTRNGFNFAPVLSFDWFANTRPDPAYYQMIIYGLIGSLTTLLVLGCLVWAENQGKVTLGVPAWLRRIPQTHVPIPVSGKMRGTMRTRPAAAIEEVSTGADPNTDPHSLSGED